MEADDLPAVEALHARMGMEYRQPDLNSPLCVARTVVEVDGTIVAAGALRLEAESYLWLEPDLTPHAKLAAMALLQKAVLKAAWKAGLDTLTAWIPETVETKFRRRLKQLGWSRDREGWHSWSRTVPPTEGHDA